MYSLLFIVKIVYAFVLLLLYVLLPLAERLFSHGLFLVCMIDG